LVENANNDQAFLRTSKMHTVPSLPAEYNLIPYAAGAHST